MRTWTSPTTPVSTNDEAQLRMRTRTAVFTFIGISGTHAGGGKKGKGRYIPGTDPLLLPCGLLPLLVNLPLFVNQFRSFPAFK